MMRTRVFISVAGSAIACLTMPTHADQPSRQRTDVGSVDVPTRMTDVIQNDRVTGVPREALETPAPQFVSRDVEVRRRVSPAVSWTFGAYTSVQVNVDGAGNNVIGDAANEPSIAVDPNRPNRMAIGWRQFDTTADNFRQAGWGYSRNGGRFWVFPGVLEPGIFRSDPVLEFDSDGNFYYNSLTYDVGGYWCSVFKSIDGGMSWNAGVYAYGGDKAWMAVDRTGGIGHGNIYTAWDYAGCCEDNWFNRSTDGGTTFDTPVPIPEQPIWGVTAVGPDGEVYIAGRRSTTNAEFIVAKSTTAADANAPLAFDFATVVDMGGVHVYYLGGLSNPNPEGLMGQVWVAVDHSSGPTRGYVYLLCSVDPPGPDPLDVHFVRSTDGGVTWSAPVRVNDDPVGTNAWQWFGTMSVAPDGRIDVVWNDTRNDPGGYDSQLTYAFSEDAGQTWSANAAVSPPFDPHLGWPNQNKLGDYCDMISDSVGAHVAYAATYNGEQDVYYLRIGDYDCNINGIADATDIADATSTDGNANGIPDECEPDVIPTVSSWGVAVLILATLATGSLILTRRRTPGARHTHRPCA